MNEAAPPQKPDCAPGTSSCWPVLWHPKARAVYKIVLALGVLVVLYMKGLLDFDDFSRKHLDLTCVFIAGLMVLPVFPVVSWRFQVILRSVGLETTYRRALQWTMIGEFYSTALPTATGGDLVKAVYVAQTYGKGRRSIAVLAVLMDRAVGLFGLFCFALLACVFGGQTVSDNPRLAGLTYLLIAVCGSGVIGFWLVIQPFVENSPLRQRLMAKLPLSGTLEKVYGGLCEMRRKKRRLFLVLGLSLANHAMWCGMLLILSRGLGQDLDLRASLVVIPLCLFLNTFGFAGGFGPGEAAFEFLFRTMLGAPPGIGATLAFAYHILTAIMRVVIGLPFYLTTARPSNEAAGETTDVETTPDNNSEL